MFSKNCEDVGMQKMYGNKVRMDETQEYNYPTSIAIHNTKVIESLSGECNLRGQYLELINRLINI